MSRPSLLQRRWMNRAATESDDTVPTNDTATARPTPQVHLLENTINLLTFLVTPNSPVHTGDYSRRFRHRRFRRQFVAENGNYSLQCEQGLIMHQTVGLTDEHTRVKAGLRAPCQRPLGAPSYCMPGLLYFGSLNKLYVVQVVCRQKTFTFA